MAAMRDRPGSVSGLWVRDAVALTDVKVGALQK